MNKDMSVGAMLWALAHRDPGEGGHLAVGLEPLPAQFHQCGEDAAVGIVAEPRTGPIDVDAEGEWVPDLVGEGHRRTNVFDVMPLETV
jgi:hypothetical protein